LQKTIQIKVTKYDIDNGVPQSAFCCAISRACKRLYPQSRPATNNDRISFEDADFKPKTVKDKNKLRRFVNNFDNPKRKRFCRPTTINLVKDL